jgi:hypothetical protein
MRIIKKMLLTLLIIFIGIQFIRPVRNESEQVLPTDITKMYNVPDNVFNALKISCYDCHSNNTNYPFYVNIEPVAWMMNNHIKNGKDKLNFSDFGTYSRRRQISKLRSIISQIKEDKMPLSFYTLIHKDAILSIVDKALIIDWSNKTKDSLLLN